MSARRIVAMGGGGFSMEPENPLLDLYVLSLARRPTPRVCFLPTAGGDSDGAVADFYRAFSAHRCRPSDLTLFDRRIADLETFLLEQDVIYVGGGNTANLLAVWRVHRVDRILRAAWESGTVLCGVSAGMNCWFAASVTDSFHAGHSLPLLDGLAVIDGSACPHYDGEPHRRPAYRQLVADGRLPGGYAADDGAGLVFEDDTLLEVVSSRPGAAAYRVTPGEGEGEAGVDEERLAARYLGA